MEASLDRNMGVGWSGQCISMCEVVGSLWAVVNVMVLYPASDMKFNLERWAG